MTQLRGLGAIRLSKETDQSTSPARQQDRIDWWCAGHEVQVVHTTKDLGVSGAVSPFERDGLGEWLTDKRADDWDVLVAWKLDRISRSAEDTLKLLNWCIKHGKRIVCVDDGIDTDTEMGKVWIQLAAIFAQVERTAIKERTLSSREKLRTEGRWAGGAPVYGSRAVARSDGAGYRIEKDPDAYPTLRWIVERVLAGDSLNSIATKLNTDEVPTPQELHRRQKGKLPSEKPPRWRTNTLTSILTSPSLIGNNSHQGRAVRGPDGLPIKSGEPLVTPGEWKQLQDRLVHGVKPRNRSEATSLLLGIAFCAVCGSRLHRLSALKRGRNYAYYRCASQSTAGGFCGAKNIREDYLNEVVEDHLMQEIGHIEIPEKILIPGEDHSAELEEAQLSLAELSLMAGTAKSDTAKQLLRAQLTALDERIADLEARPSRPDRWIERGTGATYRQQWDSGDEEKRRKLLLDSGITIRVKGDPFEFHIWVPADLREKIKR